VGNIYTLAFETILKIDSLGNKVWSSYLGNYRDDGFAFDIVVSQNGDVYFPLTDNFQKHWTIYKLNSLGYKVYSFAVEASSVGSIAIDQEGNIYLGTDRDDDTLYKFDTQGSEVWSLQQVDDVSVMAVDKRGNVYWSAEDDILHKTDPSGNEIWSFRAPGGVSDIAIDDRL